MKLDKGLLRSSPGRHRCGAPAGERCDAKIVLHRPKPWKWVCTESTFSPNPKRYDISNYTQEDVKNIFVKLEEFTKVYVFDTPTTRTTVDGGHVLDVEIILTVTVDASQEKEIGNGRNTNHVYKSCCYE